MRSDPLPEIPGIHLLQEIGRGGMATVYLAEQAALGRQVAVKLLSPRYASDDRAAERFLREGRIAAKLAHRNIVGIFDVGVADRQPYITMEYLPRGPVPEGALASEQVAAVVRDVAAALDHAHARGVVHRDVKPDNILCRDDGSYALTDFGIARVMDDDTRETQEGFAVGTPNYMSPEQLQGHPVDGRSDLYSLGVVTYQMLTGALPYQGPDGWSVGLQHIQGDVPRLPPLLSRWQPLISRLMAKSPAARPQSARDVIEWLDRLDTVGDHNATQALAILPTTQSRVRPIMLATLLLGLAGVAYRVQNDSPFLAPNSRAIAAAAPVSATARVAVLPLTVQGTDADGSLAALAQSLADGALDTLVRQNQPQVIARSSSFSTPSDSANARARGQQLAADHVVEGTVARHGETLRVTVRWVAVGDGTAWWSRRYDGVASADFDWQDRIASEIGEALAHRLAITPDTGGRGTQNSAAYQAFLRGNARLWSRQSADMQAAIAAFREAITLDPNFARGHAYLGIAMNMLDSQGIEAAPETSAIALQHLQRAIDLDPLLGEAKVGRANRLLVARNLDGAEADYRRGLELAPSFAAGHAWFARFLRLERRDFEAAFFHYRQAMVLDPLTPAWAVGYARTLSADGQDDAALAAMRDVLDKHPDNALAWQYLAELQFSAGQVGEAVRAIDTAIRKDPRAPESRVMRCRMLIAYDPVDTGRRCVEALREHHGNADATFEAAAEWHLAMGEFAAAWQSRQAMRVRYDTPIDGILLLALGRHTEAANLFQRLLPRMFDAQPTVTGHARWYPWVAAARRASGDAAGAERLLRVGLRNNAHRPWRGETGQQWSAVVAHALRGDIAQACTALDAARRGGLVEDAATLRHAPLLTAFRAAPCAQDALNRAQEAAITQLRQALAEPPNQQARDAGLLDAS